MPGKSIPERYVKRVESTGGSRPVIARQIQAVTNLGELIICWRERSNLGVRQP